MKNQKFDAPAQKNYLLFFLYNLIEMQMTKGVLYILFWIEGCEVVNYGYVPVCNDPFFYSSKEHVAP